MDAQQDMFKNGSRWLRADFHLHTRADKELGQTYKGEPNDFVRLYIEQLKKQEIGLGVITNHNKFDKDEFVALRKKARKEGIGLFAGVELSVNDGANGIHCLLVFDFEKWVVNGEDFINQFLTAAFEGVSNKENENTRCLYSLEMVLKKLNEHANNGRDSFMILAHVEQNSGFFKALDGGRIRQLSSNDLFRQFVLGFQKVRSFGKISTWENWFNRSLPAFVEGSDCKSLDEVGKAHLQNDAEKKTYLKIGDFNFEALKYALSDYGSRIVADIKPETKNSYIKSIGFDGGLLNGICIDFSPELNNLIGIRGSGKSSILEILRHTLGVSLGNSSPDAKYKNGLIENILRSGKSIVTIFNPEHGEYTIEKVYGQEAIIFKEGLEQQGISIRAIFNQPIYFGQKDLSNKDVDFEANLIQRLIGTKLKPVQTEIKNKKSAIEHLVFNLQKLENLAELKKETEIQIQNTEHQLQTYKELGVEEKLKQQTLFSSDVFTINTLLENIIRFVESLDLLTAEYDYIFQMEMLGSELNSDLFEEVSQLHDDLKEEVKKLQAIKASSSNIQSKVNEVLSKINQKEDGLKEEFAKIKQEVHTDVINPEQFIALNRKLKTSQLKLNEFDKQEHKRIDLQKQLQTTLQELDQLWEEEYRLIKNEVEKINKSDSKLSIEVIRKGRRDLFNNKLQQTFRGANIREATYEQIAERYDDFTGIYGDSSYLKDILTENQLLAFKQKFDENLNDLLTFQVENKISILYNQKRLDKHSLGQRASALILFLLAQKENDVLIIDQPEDDLDNQTIYNEVIKELKNLKGDMQFLFATHNANIPVLGDSEKVIVCNYDENKMHVHSGTIDNQETQRLIIDIMEGGDEAFSRRKNIYSIWNVEKIKR